MDMSDYSPFPALITKRTQVNKPRFPVIDAHNHLAEDFGGGWSKRPLHQLLDVFDRAGVVHFVDMDGMWNEEILDDHLNKFKRMAPERFTVFGCINWSKWPDLGNLFPEWAASRLQDQVKHGAGGLKIWKGLGLFVRDHHDQLVSVDDDRLDPIWQMAAELNIPVTMHVADPVAFFRPWDKYNERWEELHAHPDWRFPGPQFPPFDNILNGLFNLVKNHPKTTFIGAHTGCYAENLGWVGDMLDNCPNYYIDISARLAELGRQPYTARKFFIKYSSRILFGVDMPASVDIYRLYYRFLETDDEYFSYDTEEIPRQGRWRIYGIDLPDYVLERIYSLNAEKVILNSG